MDRIYLMGGGLALTGGLLLARGIRILARGEATLADALPVFGLLGRLFLGGFRLKGGWARAASLPIFLLSLIAFLGGGSLIALRYFRPQELEGVMLAAAEKLGKESPTQSNPNAVADDTLGRMKTLLAGLGPSSKADAAVTVPEADLGPIPVSQPMAKDFQTFIETPGKLSIVVLEVPQDETAAKLKEMIERVGRRFSNVAQVAYFDLDTWPEVGENEGVTEIPDVRFYRDGKKVDGFVGLPVKDVVLLEKFTRHSQGLVSSSTPTVNASHVSEATLHSSVATSVPPPLRTPTPLVRELTDQDFNAFVTQPDCLSVVVYSADWCPACTKLKPLLKIVAAEYGEVSEIGTVNVDKVSPELARKKNSNKIPEIQYYRNGKLVLEKTGCPPLATLRAHFDELSRQLRGKRVEAAKAQMVRASDEPAMQPMKKGWMPAGMEKR